MKIFLDDVRTAPSDYYRTYSVEETINKILDSEMQIARAWAYYIYDFTNHEKLNFFLDLYTITEISCDNDLGKGNVEGYKLLDWLEATGRNYPIRIHSANPVARARMSATIQKNGWKEIK